MNPKQFIIWLKGVQEANDGFVPDEDQWAIITTELAYVEDDKKPEEPKGKQQAKQAPVRKHKRG